ncbi:MAG: hypothetical protein MK213_04135, partial [Planctomycetes bacterium]|nr:hypothetical protein [Planctomycetota bacterium]
PLLPLGKALLDPAAWEILTSTRLQGLFLQTLGMSLGAAGVAFLVGLPLAFLASRTRCWGGSGAWLLLPWPLLVPPLLIAQAWHGLTGIDGIAGAAITLGLAYAPFPALFTRFALTQQSRSSHEAALLLGGPRLALQKSLAYAIPGALFGASLAFLFAAMDFAVPDYLAAVGNKFSVYAAEVFNSWRSQNYLAGVTTAVPLVLLAGFLLTLSWGLLDRYSTQEDPNSQIPRPLELKGIGRVGHGVLWLCTSLVLLLPFGRILWETGAAGPLAEGTWFGRSTASFADALDRGRLDLLRTMRTGLIAALVTLLLAPPLAMSLATMPSKRWARAVRVLLALPLLTPAVAM